MKKIGIAIVAGGLLMGTAVTAMAQDVAALVPPPKSEFMVFADRGSHALSPTAVSTIRAAANNAGTARQVTLIGRSEDAARVKDELVRQGVRADAIVVKNEVGAPLPKPGDGLSDPTDRRVTIKL
jgi:hypothetical protein